MVKTMRLASVAVALSSVSSPALVASSQASKKASDKYDPSPNILNIHIVPHTHDDVGWLKTVEQYYYGQNNTIRHACVSCILDSLIPALQSNPDRKFTYVEMAFFSMWWDEQKDEVKEVTRGLVQNGQLAFVNGGWCMHDEASTHFIGMIDQTTLGHDFLKKEFNYVPTVGWQLDPFGHSATQASLLSRDVGFNALYVGRIDYQDLNRRWETQNCEGIWDANAENAVDVDGSSDGIFWGLTGSFGGNYGAPEGFCFDILCDDDPLYGMEDNALHARMMDFLSKVRVQVDRSQGKNVMLTMGSDFQFENAIVNFKSLDLLIEQINSMEGVADVFPEFDGVSAFYSNPEIYTEYKFKEYTNDMTDQNNDGQPVTSSKQKSLRSIQSFETKQDDFFPYSDCDHCFWTGYFTSRPALKRLERVGSSFLQAARQIQTHFYLQPNKNHNQENLTGSDGSKEIDLLEKGVAIAQHHDGVSGTSKQHVAYDYAKKIQAGINEASKFVMSVFQELLEESLGLDVEEIQFCQRMHNESICELSQTETASNDVNFFMIVYNALGWKRSEIISIPVSRNETYEVLYLDDGWIATESAIVPNLNYAKVDNAANFNLLVDVPDIDPSSPKLIWIRSSKKVHASSGPHPDHEYILASKRHLRNSAGTKTESGDFIVKNKYIEGHFKGGELSKLVKGNFEFGVVAEWGYYKSFAEDSQKSGAYIFRPDKADAELERIEPIAQKGLVIETELATEVHVSYEGSWINQIVKFYKDKEYIDIEYTVGPIPIDDGIGKEVVLQIRSNVSNKRIFYTDSNGRKFMKRERSERKTWNLEEFEPVAGNFYPVNSAIFIQDDNSAMAICTDRSQGGSSLKDGAIQLMVHRRLVQDDSRGVGETLNETAIGVQPYPPFGDASRQGDGLIITGTHRILVGENVTGGRLARTQMDKMFSPMYSFALRAAETNPFREEHDLSITRYFIGELPENVQLLTLKTIRSEQNGNKSIMLRLGHAYSVEDCKVNGVPVQVDISTLFISVGYEVVSLCEKTLTGNQKKESWNQHKMWWDEKVFPLQEITSQTLVRLNPLEVKTFEVELKHY